jgi:hypothetical protein
MVTKSNKKDSEGSSEEKKNKRKKKGEDKSIVQVEKKQKSIQNKFNVEVHSLSEWKSTYILPKSMSKEQEKQNITNALTKLIIPLKNSQKVLLDGTKDDMDIETEPYLSQDPFSYNCFKKLVDETSFKNDVAQLDSLFKNYLGLEKSHPLLKQRYLDWKGKFEKNAPHLNTIRNIYNSCDDPIPPQLPRCSKSYYSKFEAEPRGLEFHERPCVLGEGCIHMLLPILHPECAEESDSQERFICREFLLPDELELKEKEGKLPAVQKLCLADNLLQTTFLKYLLDKENIEPVTIIHDHETEIEAPGEFSRENCIYPTVGKNLRGIVGPILKFFPLRYVYSKMPCSDVPSGYLKCAKYQNLNFRAAPISLTTNSNSTESRGLNH